MVNATKAECSIWAHQAPVKREEALTGKHLELASISLVTGALAISY